MSATLLHIRDLLAQGEPLPPASSEWLTRCIDRLLAGDDPRAVLGLDRAAGLRERNRLLCMGAEALPGSRWQKAEHVASLVRRHQSGRQAPGWLIEAQQAAKVPQTARMIYDIIR